MYGGQCRDLWSSFTMANTRKIGLQTFRSLDLLFRSQELVKCFSNPVYLMWICYSELCNSYTLTINEPHLPKNEIGLYVMQSHPLRRTANTKAHQLCWGDWEMGTAISCYLMHRMQSGGWPYSRCSSKSFSLCAAVFCLQVIAIIIVICYWFTNACVHACMRLHSLTVT